MDEYARAQPQHYRDPQPSALAFAPHHAQPPTADGTGTQRAPNDPMAFLEFVSCSLCSSHYDGAGGDRRAFWATSCGHILCSDPSHRHQEGICTYCNREGVVIHLIDENMPGKLRKWFQPRSQIIAGIGDSLGLMKFQFAELERLVRSQAGTIRQLEATVDECHLSLRAQKTEKEEQARQIEQLTKQVTDMRRQLGEANAQNRALQDQAAAFEQRERYHQHQIQNHISHHHRGHQQLTGPPPLMFERGQPQFAARPQEYAAPDSEPMGPPPPKRPRAEDVSQGLPFALHRSNAEFPPRPSTVVHPRLGRQLDSGFNRPASAANFATGSSTGFVPAPTNLRTNIDQYRHRPELVPSTVPIPQQRSRPPFTLARPSLTQQQWKGAPARPGVDANGADDDLEP